MNRCVSVSPLHRRPEVRRGIHDLVYPGGPVGMLLIHGLGGTPVELKPVARALAAAGYTVHCPALPGHCGTEADLVATGWRDWAAGVEQAFEALRACCDTVVVGGLSMGAVLALQLAAERPGEVDGLALYAPTLRYDGWSIPWYRFLLKVVVHLPIGRRYRFPEQEPYGIKDPRIRARVAASMLGGDSAASGLAGTPARSLRELWRLVAAVRGRLPAITAPTLLVQAREDDIASLSNTTILMRRLGGLVDVTVLDDSYHIVTIDRQRRVVIDRTLAWLDRLAGRAEQPCRVAGGVLS